MASWCIKGRIDTYQLAMLVLNVAAVQWWIYLIREDDAKNILNNQ